MCIYTDGITSITVSMAVTNGKTSIIYIYNTNVVLV